MLIECLWHVSKLRCGLWFKISNFVVCSAARNLCFADNEMNLQLKYRL